MRRLVALGLGIALLPAGLVAEAAGGGAFFAVSVADLDASVAWYRETLELTPTRLPGSDTVRVALLQGDGVIVELIEHGDAVTLEEPLPSADRRYLVHGLFKAGFFVADLDATVTRLRERGARFRGEVFQDAVLGARSILLLDNSGNVLQLFERLPPGEGAGVPTDP